ncbi:MAG: hypothetical protein HOQ28_04230 [Thermoleophilia bacterium]|nr:hypothetical protein [Thermoleophilia bacterium]
MLRAPHLYESMRAFCLSAFAAERGAQVPFAFEEHATREGPSLYEYRPLVRGFVEEQSPTLRRLPDARHALEDLKREPAAAIFARAHSGIGDTGDEALYRSILVPMLTWTAERCGGFDWDDEAFDAAYADLERTLFGTARTYVALAPVVGLSAGSDADLGAGITLRPVVAGEISNLWPEARGLMPPDFAREIDRLLLLELRRELEPDESEPPDAAAELADAVTALRLATAGAVAAGPVVFERLDFRPLRIAPLLPIAATQPRGDATRLDKVRARLTADLRARLTLADGDRELGEALDRWELSLFSEEPFRSAQVRESLTCLLGGDGGTWAAAMRSAVLLGDKTRERSDLLEALREERLGHDARDAVRRALVETLSHGNRAELVVALDDTLLGLRPRPSSVLRVA